MTAPATPAPPFPATPASRRPGWLTFFAIVAIVLGAVKGLGGLSTLATPRLLAAQHDMMKSLRGDAENPMTRLQTETEERIAAIMNRRHGFFVLTSAFAIVSAIALVAGGIGSLSLRRRARLLLLSGFALGLIVELAAAKPTIDMQREIAEANTSMISRAFETGATTGAGTSPGAAESMKNIGSTFASVATSIGLISAIVFIVARIGFFAWGLLYLAREKTRLLFEG